MMKKIGLTGSMGSGKSTVAGIFKALDIPVYHSDQAAKDLMHSNSSVIKSLCRKFGSDIYNAEGVLQNARLAAIVYQDKKALSALNAIVHPVVLDDYDNWCSSRSGHPYTIIESAILIETGIYKKLDATICVYAPPESRIRYIMKRDRLTPKQIMQRIENQASDADKMQVSDYVIINDEMTSLVKQVCFLHTELVSN